VVDYPSATSLALLESVARRAAHGIGFKTEPYRVFSDREIDGAFESHGFRVASRQRQFVLPIAFHKRLGSPGFTIRVERLLRRAGLLRVLGSPVTILAERCASS